LGSKHLRQDEGRREIDVQHAAPGGNVVLLERRAIAEQSGGVHQSVQLAEFPVDRVGQPVVIRPPWRSRDRAARWPAGGAERDDLIVQPIELGAVAAGEHDARARASAFDRERPPEAAARPGDENRAPREVDGRKCCR
jgi:hypothetical protein